jgi:hypothetical protein
MLERNDQERDHIRTVVIARRRYTPLLRVQAPVELA